MALEALAQDEVEGRGAGALGDGRVPDDVVGEPQQPVPVLLAEELGKGATVEGEPVAGWAGAGLARDGGGVACLLVRVRLVGVHVGVGDRVLMRVGGAGCVCLLVVVMVVRLVVIEAGSSPLVVSEGRECGGLPGGKRVEVLVEVSRLHTVSIDWCCRY